MNWLRIFSFFKRSRPSAVEDEFTPFGMINDPAYTSNASVVNGSEFMATLHVTTPLNVLIHHGEVFRGSPERAPKYGNQAQGIWLWKTKSWAELGAKNVPEFSPSPQATDIGPQQANAYLPFLVEFRQTFESASTDEQKLIELRALSKRSQTYSEFWAKLKKNYPDFPHCFFYEPLLVLPGVGPKIAQALYKAGYRTSEQVVGADAARLKSIPGIGEKLAAKIKAGDRIK